MSLHLTHLHIWTMEKQQSNPTAAAVDYVLERASRTVVAPLSISYEVNHKRKGWIISLRCSILFPSFALKTTTRYGPLCGACGIIRSRKPGNGGTW